MLDKLGEVLYTVLNKNKEEMRGGGSHGQRRTFYNTSVYQW